MGHAHALSYSDDLRDSGVNEPRNRFRGPRAWKGLDSVAGCRVYTNSRGDHPRAMTIGIPTARSSRYRALVLPVVLSLAAVLLSAPCRVLVAAAAPSSHECCDDHCDHEQRKSPGCETLCEARTSNVLISPTADFAPARAAESVVVSDRDRFARARTRPSIDPAITDSSPPLYVKNGALLI